MFGAELRPRRSNSKRLPGKLVRLLSILLLGAVIVTPVSSQQPRPTPARKPPAERTPAEPVVTFDNLLATDTYRVYGEVRSVGQLVRSAGVNDIVDPLIKLTTPPREFRAAVGWLEANAEELATSRMAVAFWPLRPQLPQVLIAIEFPSPQEAEKFAPKLREFLPEVWPTPAPTPGADAPAQTTKEEKEARPQDEKPTPSPFHVRRSGTLVLLTDSTLNLRNLRPAGSKLLSESANFRMARDRFSSESVFVYLDIAAEDAIPKPTPPEMAVAVGSPPEDKVGVPGAVEPPPPPAPIPEEVIVSRTVDPPTPNEEQGRSTSPPRPVFDPRLTLLLVGALTGPPQWPEAVGVGLMFDGASYAMKVLLVSGFETRAPAIPFIPQLKSGPALAPQSPSIMPADSELFVTLSVDFPQIHQGIAKTFQEQRLEARTQPAGGVEPMSPFASFEKEFGISIEKDLLPLLGNEVALTMAINAPIPAPADSSQTKSQGKPPEPTPVIAIAIKDREAMRTLIGKMLDSAGLKGAQLLAQTDRQDNSELISFGNAFSYAFIDNFLVGSADPSAIRKVVDSYRAKETLWANGDYRAYSRWQPRQVLGQLYVAPAAAKSYAGVPIDLLPLMSDNLSDFLSRLSPIMEPITYALSNEGLGPLHEIHLPKNFVMMVIAGMAIGSKETPMLTNEMATRGVLRTIASAQESYRATREDNQYATLDELIAQGLLEKNMVHNYGYSITVTVSGNTFTATAIPTEYGKTGKNSFFMDESGILRGGDHGGALATVGDSPID